MIDNSQSLAAAVGLMLISCVSVSLITYRKVGQQWQDWEQAAKSLAAALSAGSVRQWIAGREEVKRIDYGLVLLQNWYWKSAGGRDWLRDDKALARKAQNISAKLLTWAQNYVGSSGWSLTMCETHPNRESLHVACALPMFHLYLFWYLEWVDV